MNNILTNQFSKHPESFLFFPVYIYLYKNYKEYGRVFFFIIVSSLSLYEFINNEMYYFHKNDINEYNYIGDKCRILCSQYFFIDLFFVKDKTMYIHHTLALIIFSQSYIYNRYFIQMIYGSLTEISSIFLSLKFLKVYPKISNILFLSTFFVFRILLLPLVTYIHINDKNVFTLLCLDCLLHVYWITKIIKKNLKKKL